jgi:hypothetical protein
VVCRETGGKVGGSTVDEETDVEETDGLTEVDVEDGGLTAFGSGADAGAAFGADWVGVGC